MRSQQQIKKQAEENNLTENPERLEQSMDKRAFLRQDDISPGSKIEELQFLRTPLWQNILSAKIGGSISSGPDQYAQVSL
jgi:hypothetical protein